MEFDGGMNGFLDGWIARNVYQESHNLIIQ